MRTQRRADDPGLIAQRDGGGDQVLAHAGRHGAVLIEDPHEVRAGGKAGTHPRIEPRGDSDIAVLRKDHDAGLVRERLHRLARHLRGVVDDVHRVDLGEQGTHVHDDRLVGPIGEDDTGDERAGRNGHQEAILPGALAAPPAEPAGFGQMCRCIVGRCLSMRRS